MHHFWFNSLSSCSLFVFSNLLFSLTFASVLPVIAAKYDCLPQPCRPQWFTLPAGWHGGPPLHAAAGERGANGRHRGTQRPACGAARRGTHLSFSLCCFISVGLRSVYPPDCPLAPLPSAFHYLSWQSIFLLVDFLLLPFLLITPVPLCVTIDFLMVYGPKNS